MKLLSDASEYGLRAVVFLAQNPGGPKKLREIAAATRSPAGYLIKMLQALAKAKILSVQRGSNGGFVLRRDPARLTVLEVINVIDPLERIEACPLKLETHGACLCPMHRRLDNAMSDLEATFAGSTIHDLISEPAASRPLIESDRDG